LENRRERERERGTMSRLVHFVIAVDIDKKTAFIDDETFTAKFNKESLYDTESQQWRSEDYENEYLPALHILNTTELG
jgi:hypothetical protein